MFFKKKKQGLSKEEIEALKKTVSQEIPRVVPTVPEPQKPKKRETDLFVCRKSLSDTIETTTQSGQIVKIPAGSKVETFEKLFHLTIEDVLAIIKYLPEDSSLYKKLVDIIV